MQDNCVQLIDALDCIFIPIPPPLISFFSQPCARDLTSNCTRGIREPGKNLNRTTPYHSVLNCNSRRRHHHHRSLQVFHPSWLSSRNLSAPPMCNRAVYRVYRRMDREWRAVRGEERLYSVKIAHDMRARACPRMARESSICFSQERRRERDYTAVDFLGRYFCPIMRNRV